MRPGSLTPGAVGMPHVGPVLAWALVDLSFPRCLLVQPELDRSRGSPAIGPGKHNLPVGLLVDGAPVSQLVRLARSQDALVSFRSTPPGSVPQPAK